MSITRGGITRGGITSGGILRSQQGQPYAFNFDLATLKDLVTGKSLTTVISGTRYDEVDGVVTAFGSNVPTVTEKGLRTVGSYTNMIKNNESFNTSNWTNTNMRISNNVITSNTASSYARILSSVTGTLNVDTSYTCVITIRQSTYSQNFSTSIVFRGNATVQNNTNYAPTVGKKIFTAISTNPLNTLIDVGIYLNPNFYNGVAVLNDSLLFVVDVFNTTYALPHTPTTASVYTSPSEAGSADNGNKFNNLATDFPALYKTLNGDVVSGVKQI